MKFCTRCGTSIPNGKQFCSSCGARISKNHNNIQLSTTVNKLKNLCIKVKATYLAYLNPLIIKIRHILRNKKFKFTKAYKIVSIITFIFIALGIISFQVGKSQTSRENTIAQFTNALKSKNTNILIKLIKCSDPRLKIDDTSINSFIDYLDKNPSYLQTITDSLSQQSANFDDKSNNSTRVYNNNDSNNLITLKAQGKKFFFYDNYVFELKAQFINLYTNYKGTQILINDKELCTSDRQNFTSQFGPFLPGEYKIQANYKNDYTSITKNIEVNLIGSAPIDVQLNLGGHSINISSEYDDANIFVNGKDTGLKVKDAKNFGPVPTDETVSVYAQMDFPWGTIKSDEVKITTSSEITLNFNPVNDILTNTLMSTINDFNKSWFIAYINRDVTKITNATPNMINYLSSEIEFMKSNKQLFKGTLNKTIFDLDSVKVYKSNDKFYAEINDIEYLDSAFYGEADMNVTTQPNTNYWKYQLIYDQNSRNWFVDTNSTQYSFAPKNKKEF